MSYAIDECIHESLEEIDEYYTAIGESEVIDIVNDDFGDVLDDMIDENGNCSEGCDNESCDNESCDNESCDNESCENSEESCCNGQEGCCSESDPTPSDIF